MKLPNVYQPSHIYQTQLANFCRSMADGDSTLAETELAKVQRNCPLHIVQTIGGDTGMLSWQLNDAKPNKINKVFWYILK